MPLHGFKKNQLLKLNGSYKLLFFSPCKVQTTRKPSIIFFFSSTYFLCSLDVDNNPPNHGLVEVEEVIKLYLLPAIKFFVQSSIAASCFKEIKKKKKKLPSSRYNRMIRYVVIKEEIMYSESDMSIYL